MYDLCLLVRGYKDNREPTAGDLVLPPEEVRAGLLGDGGCIRESE